MQINYNKNPLLTTVELDESDKKELWYKIKIKEMENLLSEAEFCLQEGKFFKIEDARKYVDSTYYENDNGEKSKLDKRCDMLLATYLEELQNGHSGDCVCYPCSCVKCEAEYLLGIDTIKGLGKHEANQMYSVFGKNNENTIDEAINILKNYKPIVESPERWEKLGGYEQYIPRWTEEAKRAHDWLLNYKNTYFKGD